MKSILGLVAAGFFLGTGFLASHKLWGFLGDKITELTDPEVARLKDLAEKARKGEISHEDLMGFVHNSVKAPKAST